MKTYLVTFDDFRGQAQRRLVEARTPLDAAKRTARCDVYYFNGVEKRFTVALVTPLRGAVKTVRDTDAIPTETSREFHVRRSTDFELKPVVDGDDA